MTRFEAYMFDQYLKWFVILAISAFVISVLVWIFEEFIPKHLPKLNEWLIRHFDI